MSNPVIKIHNLETNEVIEREMTNQEIGQLESDRLKAEQVKAEAETKAAQKAALLDRLGITEDEAKLLLS